jgi:DNA-directed RNA polymerase subunit RPC12/RpoP
MGRVRDELRACERCKEPFSLTRAGQATCPRCRRRLALERHAAKRLHELTEIEGALTAGLVIVRRELDRWRNVAGGSPRKRGGWRQSPSRSRPHLSP